MNKFIDQLVRGLNESISDSLDLARDTIETICIRTNNEAEWIMTDGGTITDQKIQDEYSTRRDFINANKGKKMFTIHAYDSKFMLAIPEADLEDEKIQDLLGELNAQDF